MMEGTSKPTIPSVLARFAVYLEANPSWGSLHVVLDEGNVGDSTVVGCMEWAARHDDLEGIALADILLLMSKSQRGRMDRKAREYLERRNAQEDALDDVNEDDLEDL